MKNPKNHSRLLKLLSRKKKGKCKSKIGLEPSVSYIDQDRSAYISKICIRVIAPYCHVDLDHISHSFSMIQGCIMILTQGHISMLQYTHSQNPCQDNYSFLPRETQSYDKSPHIHRKIKNATKHKKHQKLRLHNACGPTKDGKFELQKSPH